VPSRQTVVRAVSDLASKCRIDLRNELSEPLRAKAVTIAPDFWHSKHNKQSFLGVSATYVTSSYQYKLIDLLCRPFNGIKSYDLNLEVSQKNISLDCFSSFQCMSIAIFFIDTE
jgi:hypothetical protein